MVVEEEEEDLVIAEEAVVEEAAVMDMIATDEADITQGHALDPENAVVTDDAQEADPDLPAEGPDHQDADQDLNLPPDVTTDQLHLSKRENAAQGPDQAARRDLPLQPTLIQGEGRVVLAKSRDLGHAPTPTRAVNWKHTVQNIDLYVCSRVAVDTVNWQSAWQRSL